MRIVVLLVIGVILNSCALFEEVFPSGAVIKFKDPMYNPYGRKIKSINIRSGNAYILFNTAPNTSTSATTGVVSTEPRARKNVRLGGYFFGGWANGRQMSSDQLNWISETLDVLCLNPHYVRPEDNYNGGITPDQVLMLKQQNRILKFYTMLFATTLREPLFDPSTMSDWVVKYSTGIEALGVRRETHNDPDHLMDLGNKDYANFFRNFILEHTKQYHADGVAIDEVMWNGYWGLALVDMRDYNSNAEIRQSCYDWLEIIKKDNPKEVIHQAFWSDAQEHTDGIWGESAFHWWMRVGEDYKIFYEEMNFKEIIESIRDHSRNNETYIWAAYYERDNLNKLEYCIAAYLLGKEGNSVVFHPQPTWDGGYPNNLGGYDISTVIEEYQKHRTLYDIELGTPLGTYYTEVISGEEIWVRKFTKGVIYINPN